MKRLALVLAAVLMGFTASAQFTIIGGLTTTSGKFSDTFRMENLSQFHAGLGYTCRIGLGFSLQPALEYNARATTISGTKFRTGYVELPVQLQLGLSLLPHIIRLYAIGEPYLAYAVHRDVFSGSSWQKLDWGDVERFRYGVGVGGGLELFRHLQVSARFFWDFAGSEFVGIKEIPTQIRDNKAAGIKVSAAIIF